MSNDGSESQTNIQLITKELLETVIRRNENNENVSVKSFTVSPGCDKGSSYASVVLAVKVVLQIGEKETLDHMVFKIPHKTGLLRNWVEEWGDYFAKESYAYMDVIPATVQLQRERGLEPIRPPFPLHYYSKVDGINGFIVLKDLRPDGYVMADTLKGLDEEHCRLVVKELANFHALSFGLKNGNPGNLKQFDTALQEAMIVKLYSDVFGQTYKASLGLVKMFTKDNGVAIAAEKMAGMDMLQVLKKHIEPIEPYAVICHGDIWLANTLFKYEKENERTRPVDAKLLDLQFFRYALPTTDLAYFFYTSTTRTMRKKSLKTLLALYHFHFTECLHRLGINFPEFSLEVLEKLFKQSVMFGVILSCSVGFLMLAGPDNATDLSQSSEEIVDHVNEQIKRMLARKENHYLIQERIVGGIEEAVEMGLV